MRSTGSAEAEAIQPHDVVQLCHYFGASDTAVLYRLGNLGYLSDEARERLWECKAEGQLRELHRAFFQQREAKQPQEHQAGQDAPDAVLPDDLV